MLTVQVKLSVEEIIAALQDLDVNEIEKFQMALFHLREETALEADVREGLRDIENGRAHSHDAVMKEIKAKYKSN